MDLALSKLLKNRNITKVAHMCNNNTCSDGRNSMYVVLFFFLFFSFKDISSVSPPNCRYLTQLALSCLQNSKLDQLLYNEISLCWKSLIETAVNINLLLPLMLTHLLLPEEFSRLQSSSFLCFVTEVAYSPWQKPDTYLVMWTCINNLQAAEMLGIVKSFLLWRRKSNLVLHSNLWSVTI